MDNKRLGRTLEFIKLVQDKRDNNRSQALPAGDGPSKKTNGEELPHTCTSGYQAYFGHVLRGRRLFVTARWISLAVHCFPGQAILSRNGIILAAHTAAFQQSWRAQATAGVPPDNKYKNPVVLPTIQAGSAEVFRNPAMAG